MATVIDQSGGAQERQRQQQQQDAQKALTRVQRLQKAIQHAPDLPQFLQELIYMQAVTVAGTEAIAFAVRPAEQSGFLLDLIKHIRPDDSTPEQREAAVQAFKEIVMPCVQQGKDGAIEVDGADASGEIQYCLVTLLSNEQGHTVAVTAVITRCRDLQRAQQRLDSMRLVAGYFDIFLMRRKLEHFALQARTHQDVLQFSSAFATAEGFTAAAMGLCNELATRTGAARVSLGWRRLRNIRLKAMSHTENFDRKQELSVMIEKVMDECADQEAPVHYEADGTGSENITRMAQQLSRAEGGATIISLPMRRGGEVKGVITLEFAPGTKLNPGAINGLVVAAELLAPQLHDRYENDRWWITKTGLSALHVGKIIAGPKHRLGVLIALLLAGFLAFICLYKPMYRVSAPFTFVTSEKRIVSAPYEGILAEVFVRPGDRVKAGDVLAKMKTDEYELQMIAKEREMEAKYREAAKLKGEGKIAEALTAEKIGDAARASAAFYRLKVNQGTIRSPIDGEIFRGDLRDKQGTSVRLGEELFQVGSRDGEKLEIEMLVHERDIQAVQTAQRKRLENGEEAIVGELATTSLPSEKVPFAIRRLVPIGEPKDNKNVFKVYAEIIGAGSKDWLPGVAGEVKIDIAPRPLIWQWTHRFVDWVKMKAWTWL
ncbi:MAG: HlyD family efflux transporter periplasmic adaptor subunit [Phycisphaerae bacterium]|nr:HlyD family efflux transporter periplasmic adaptor subunit [Phycisphaerae bacterium]MDW8263019.1 HlyD family efflux transporter periplasmic adaptor subunit [Phycisphaerales bacterium]